MKIYPIVSDQRKTQFFTRCATCIIDDVWNSFDRGTKLTCKRINNMFDERNIPLQVVKHPDYAHKWILHWTVFRGTFYNRVHKYVYESHKDMFESSVWRIYNAFAGIHARTLFKLLRNMHDEAMAVSNLLDRLYVNRPKCHYNRWSCPHDSNNVES